MKQQVHDYIHDMMDNREREYDQIYEASLRQQKVFAEVEYFHRRYLELFVFVAGEARLTSGNKRAERNTICLTRHNETKIVCVIALREMIDCNA